MTELEDMIVRYRAAHYRADVIERLQAATEGSTELDVAIHIALYDPPVMTRPGNRYGGEVGCAPASEVFSGGWKDWEAAAVTIGALRYTRSLDAAVALFPEGSGYAILYTPVSLSLAAGVAITARQGQIYSAQHNKPPIAACIAALQALEDER